MQVILGSARSAVSRSGVSHGKDRKTPEGRAGRFRWQRECFGRRGREADQGRGVAKFDETLEIAMNLGV